MILEEGFRCHFLLLLKMHEAADEQVSLSADDGVLIGRVCAGRGAGEGSARP